MAKLETFCNINMGQSPDSTTYNEVGNGLPFFQGNADFGQMHPNVRIWCSNPTKIASANDILISVRAPIGALNIANEQCCIGRGLAALTVNAKLCHAKYLWYGLESKVEELNNKGIGSTFKAINKKTLSETEVYLPSISEQRRIASILDKVTDLIAKRRAQLEKLDLLVKSRFVEMFGDEAQRKKLSEICTIITDGTHQPPRFVDSGIPFLFVSNIVTNEITYNTQKFISQNTYNELIKRTPIEVGDILLSTVGSYGHAAIVKQNKRFLFQRHIAYLKPNYEMVCSDYLHTALLSFDAQNQIEKAVKGVAQKTLNLSEIRNIVLPIPTMQQQTEFSQFIVSTNKTKSNIQKSLETLETLKKALMQEYFG